MKVLEYGHIKPDIIKCTACDATLEYTKNDVIHKGIHDKTYEFIFCPVCGKLIFV